MNVELTFEYSYMVQTPAGERVEGGGQTIVEVEHEQVLSQRELLMVAFDVVLEQLEGLFGDRPPEVMIGLKGLTWTK